MSRIAKAPVEIPGGVEVKLDGQEVTVKGAKGSLAWSVHKSVEVAFEENQLKFAARDGSKASRALAGTSRALLNNMVTGVAQGFEKKLQLVGVGYRAKATGNTISLSLGFSHPIDYVLPEGITATTPSVTDRN